jgi:hypothetical protein
MARVFTTCLLHPACVVETGETFEVHHDSDGNDKGGFVVPTAADRKVRFPRLRRRLSRVWRWTRRKVLAPILKEVSQAAWKVSAKTASWYRRASS